MEQEDALNLAIRRMLRASNTYHVVHIAYSRFGFIRGNKEIMLLLQNQAQDIAQPHGGTIYQMHRGDQFIVFNEAAGAKVPEVVDDITAAAFPDRKIGDDEDQVLARVFIVPQDYVELRRTINAYLDAAAGLAPATAAAPAVAPDTTAEAKLLKEELDGPITPLAVGRIERMLDEFDLSGYLRTQIVYETDHHGRWNPLFEEHFVSVADLHRDRFPKLTFRNTERLYVELCRALDRRSVPEILRRHRGKPAQRISLNLTLATCTGAFFSKFIRDSEPFERQSIVLEINRSDILHEPREAIKAMADLRAAGFAIALDGITLDLLTLTNLHRIELDYIKIALMSGTLGQLKNADCVTALKMLPREKIILCRCEKASTIPVGQAFGFTRFQGWVIDRLATGAAPHPETGGPDH